MNTRIHRTRVDDQATRGETTTTGSARYRIGTVVVGGLLAAIVSMAVPGPLFGVKGCYDFYWQECISAGGDCGDCATYCENVAGSCQEDEDVTECDSDPQYCQEPLILTICACEPA